MSWYGSRWVHLNWDSLSFLDLDVCFPPQIRKIFSHYFLKIKNLCPFLSLSSSRPPIMWMLVFFLNSFFFLVTALFGWVLLPHLSVDWYFLLLLVWYWMNPSNLFLTSSIVVFSSMTFILYLFFLSLCWSSYYVHLFFPWFHEHLYEHYFKLFIR